LKQINPPQFVHKKYNFPNEIKINLNEISRIYSLFYTHPCIFYKCIDGMSINEFEKFFEGLKPLFQEINCLNKKCVNLDNTIFLSFFKIIIGQDLKIVQNNVDMLYLERTSYARVLLNLYFFNYYGRSVLLDLFRNSLLSLYSICEIYSKDLTSKNDKNNKNKNNYNFDIFNKLLSFVEGTDTNKGIYEDEKTKNLVTKTIELMKSMCLDLKHNFETIPIYVSFCTSLIYK